MRKGNLTREQAVELVGENAVAAADNDNCDFTNRCMDDCDSVIEFSGSSEAVDKDGYECSVIAYYYPSAKEVEDAGDDLGNVNWVIEGYEVI